MDLFSNIKHRWIEDTGFKKTDTVFKRLICIKCHCFLYLYNDIKGMKQSYIMDFNTQISESICKETINCIRCKGYKTYSFAKYVKCKNCPVINNGEFNKSIIKINYEKNS